MGVARSVLLAWLWQGYSWNLSAVGLKKGFESFDLFLITSSFQEKATILAKFYFQPLQHLFPVTIELLQLKNRRNSLDRNSALAAWHLLCYWISPFFFLYDYCLYSIITYDIIACNVLFQNSVFYCFYMHFHSLSFYRPVSSEGSYPPPVPPRGRWISQHLWNMRFFFCLYMCLYRHFLGCLKLFISVTQMISFPSSSLKLWWLFPWFSLGLLGDL